MEKELGNIFAGLQNREKGISLETMGDRNQADLLAKQLSNKEAGVNLETLGDKNLADIFNTKAQTGNYQASSNLHNIQAKEIADRIRHQQQMGILPDNGVPFALMGANEKLAASKEITQQQKFAQGQVKVNKIANEMRKIIDEHPNMADDFASAIANAGEKPGVLSKIKRRFANKKDLAAFEKFNKLSNDLILQQGESYGKNFTDAKATLLAMAKPNPTNTDEANKYLIGKLINDSSPAKAYHEALEKGRKGRYMPTLDMEAYRGSMSDDNSQMVTIRNSKTGETKQVTREEAEKLTGKKR